MVAQSRTLKLSILADVDQLKKSLNSANADVQNSSNKLGDFSKKAGIAFAAAAAAAGAYAVKLAVDGVKAAIEDEAAQIRLATSLKNTTGATDLMIASVEKQILKTSLATGVADDKLRPALGRLATSTGDVTKAQDLLSLALDISQASGKSLDSVANSLGKAFDGNTSALGKLGIGLTAAELKTMSFDEVQTKLTDLFGGAAAANAETYEGKIARLKVGFDEAKETLGVALLPQVEKFVDFINQQALPSLEGIIAGFTGDTGFSNALGDSESTAYQLGVEMKKLGNTFGSFFSLFDSKDANSFNGFLAVVKGLITGIQIILIPFQITLDLIVRSINALISGLNMIPGVDIKPLKNIVPIKGDPNYIPPNGFTSISGVLGTSTNSIIKQQAPVPNVVGNTARINTPSSLNITVNGAIDSEGTARTIVNTLNNSYFRGTGGAGALITP
jgi:hypothetical protein